MYVMNTAYIFLFVITQNVYFNYSFKQTTKTDLDIRSSFYPLPIAPNILIGNGCKSLCLQGQV